MSLRRKGRLRGRVAAVAGLLGLLALATALDAPGGARLWINLYWLVAAAGAVGLSLSGEREQLSHRRSFRRSITLSLWFYLMAQVGWFVQVAVGWRAVPGPSDALFLASALTMTWTIVRVTRHRMEGAAELVLTLDSVTVGLACAVVALSLLGPHTSGLAVSEGAVLLLYPILFLAPAGGTLVCALAWPAKLEWKGIWVLLAAWSVLGVGFSVWTLGEMTGGVPAGSPIDYSFGVGLLLAGYGAATWPRPRATAERQIRILRRLSDALPLLAVVLAVVAALTTRGGAPLTALTVTVGIVMIAAYAFREFYLTGALRASRRRLRAMATELSTVEDRERRQIASFLHDQVGQTLALLAMRHAELGSATDAERAKAIRGEIESLLADMTRQVRSTTLDLSPPNLSKLGLGPTLEWLGESLCAKHALEFSFQDDGRAKPLHEDMAALLFRLVRELLLNVVKHARASKLSLGVKRQAGAIVITVEDDGCGFDVKGLVEPQGEHGFGLFSVRERVRSIGGRLRVESRPGEGTRATLSAPLEREHRVRGR